MIAIRRAVASDAAEIRALASAVQELHAVAMPGLFKSGGSVGESQIVARIRTSGVHAYWVAEQDGAIVGHAYAELVQEAESAWRYAHRFVALHELAVAERARGAGVGSRLLAAVREWASGTGAARLVVNVWGFNDGARRLYAREGFRTLHERLTFELERGST